MWAIMAKNRNVEAQTMMQVVLRTCHNDLHVLTKS